MSTVHKPVLLNETIKGFVDNSEEKPDRWYIDGTLGGGGHAFAVIEAFRGRVNVLGLDRDPRAIERARSVIAGRAGQIILECEDYRKMDEIMDKHSIKEADMILLDLGISSDELESSGRGFTFMKDEPLLMTFGNPASYHFTAKEIVNGWKEEDIANVIFAYGEERFSRRIAKAIVNYREKKHIETSGELAEIVKNCFKGRPGKIHPATRTFQALRIAVNDELGALKDGLQKGWARLAKGGVMEVISFHSLEDRIVKNFFKETDGSVIITKKPLVASLEEVAENPRSRSAKLRIIKKKI